MSSKVIRFLSLLLCFSLFSNTVFANAPQELPDDTNITTIGEPVFREDGTFSITMMVNGEEQIWEYKPVEESEIALSSTRSWLSPTYRNYEAKASVQIGNLALSALLNLMLTAADGPSGFFTSAILELIQEHFGLLFTVYAVRTTWWQDDYYMYRLQDKYYTDSARTNYATGTGVREFYVYNKTPIDIK